MALESINPRFPLDRKPRCGWTKLLSRRKTFGKLAPGPVYSCRSLPWTTCADHSFNVHGCPSKHGFGKYPYPNLPHSRIERALWHLPIDEWYLQGSCLTEHTSLSLEITNTQRSHPWRDSTAFKTQLWKDLYSPLSRPTCRDSGSHYLRDEHMDVFRMFRPGPAYDFVACISTMHEGHTLSIRS
jgi:hypothetical protein